MEYFFILGRNLELSTAEIFSYLEKEGIKRESYCKKENALLIDLDREINISMAISQLGGVIAIGRVLYSGSLDEISENIANREIYSGEKTKFNYAVLNFSDEASLNNITSAIKNKFKLEGFKAGYKSAKGEVKIQNGDVVIGSPSKLQSAEIVYFLFKNTKNYFGVIQDIYNPMETEKRDMGKPVRREALAISPRLSKILINLSQVKEKEVLLDPFCGVGIILQEALLQGVNVIGADIDKNAAEDAKRNLLWFKKTYNIKLDYTVVNEDSKKIRLRKIDSIATEPSLGILVKKTPNRQQADSMINKFEKLIIDVLNNLKKYIKKNGKIAFTAPMVRTEQGNFSCNINKICRRTGLELYKLKDIKFPIKEYREKQFVGRQFYVLVKKF